MDVEEARNRLSEMIETLSTAAAPFEVSFLKARVRHTSREPYPLDLMRTAAGLQLFFLRDTPPHALIGAPIAVDAPLSMPTDKSKEASTYVDYRLPGANAT